MCAGVYPEGDIRNTPAVRNHLIETAAARGMTLEEAVLAPVGKIASDLGDWESRYQHRKWQDWADDLANRVTGDAYVKSPVPLSKATIRSLKRALVAVRRDLEEGGA